MTGNRPSIFKRTYLIKPGFQLGLVLALLVTLALGMCGASVLLYVYANKTLTATFECRHLAVTQTGDVLLPALMVINLVTLAAVGFACYLVVLLRSHRLAGPLYRFEQILGRMSRGDLRGGFKLRRHDQLASLMEATNQALEGLRGRVGDQEEALARIEEVLSREGACGSDCPDCRRLREELSQAAEQLRRNLDGFQVR